MAVANTRAYYNTAPIAAVKGFIVQALGTFIGISAVIPSIFFFINNDFKLN
jgi:hypothetical protein